MKIEINNQPINRNGWLIKISLVLIGILINTLIFAGTLNLFEAFGIWVGAILILILVFCGYYFFEAGSKIRIITWTMLATLILAIISYIIGLHYITKSLEGF